MRSAAMLLFGSLLLSNVSLPAADVPDDAFGSLLKKVDPTLTVFSTIGSKHVTEALDVVLVIGKPTDEFSGNQAFLSRLGVFLQDRQHKGEVYLVGSEPEVSSYCEPEIKVLTATDVVLGCGIGPYGPVSEDIYLLYDIDTRTIVRHARLYPFYASSVLRERTGDPIFIMMTAGTIVPVGVDGNGRFRVVTPQDSRVLTELGIRPGMSVSELSEEANKRLSDDQPFDKAFSIETMPDDEFNWRHAVVEQTASGKKQYLLPQSSYEKYLALRPGELPVEASIWENFRKEGIGPFQKEGRRLWFGKNFMSGERTGVGAFGYFDMGTRTWTLYTPSEVAPWSVSSILVDPDAIWLGLDRPYDEAPAELGGIVRWDRRTKGLRQIPFDWGVNYLVRRGNDIYVGAGSGLAVIRGNRIDKFVVSIGRSGYDVVRATGLQ